MISSASSAEALLGRIVKLKKDDSGLQVSDTSTYALSTPLAQLTTPPSLSLQVALLSALWGNKMDLSIWPADSDGSVDVFTSIVENAANNLLWDDTPTLIPSMLTSSPCSVHIIVDNAGFEVRMNWNELDALALCMVNASHTNRSSSPPQLVTDLALADYLIASGVASTVTFQLKGHPTFVSDAMESDLLETVEHFSKLGGSHPNCAAAGERWSKYLVEGKWICREVSEKEE